MLGRSRVEGRGVQKRKEGGREDVGEDGTTLERVFLYTLFFWSFFL